MSSLVRLYNLDARYDIHDQPVGHIGVLCVHRCGPSHGPQQGEPSQTEEDGQ